MTVDCGTVETGLPANRPILRLKAAVPGNTLQAATFFPSQVRAVHKPTAIDISQVESRTSQTRLDQRADRYEEQRHFREELMKILLQLD